MPTHTVKPGDTWISIAARYRLKDWQSLANAPENATLKEKRPDPGILHPGDQVFVPSKELKQEPTAIDAKHTFKITRPKAWLRLVVHDAAGEPIASKPYQLTVEGKVVSKGELPADALLEVQVPVTATEGRLTVFLDDGKFETWDLRIGSMDPLDEISGVQARLNNLGFDCGPPTGELNPKTEAAIRAFQARLGLEETGAIDDTLRGKLKTYYDPAEDEKSVDAELTVEEEEEDTEAAG